MKTICIKTISEDKINFMIELLEDIPINICISNYRFKTYDNLIIHNLNEEDLSCFYDIVTIVLRKTIEFFYEENLIEKYIEKNYFYLSSIERKYIFEITKKILELPDEKIGDKRKLLDELIKEYLLQTNRIIIEGFVNFRIKKYKELLERIVEVSVFSYLDLITF